MGGLGEEGGRFSSRRFSQLLNGANQAVESQQHAQNTVTDTFDRRGRAVQSKVEAGQVSPCTTKVDWSQFGSEDAGDTR